MVQAGLVEGFANTGREWTQFRVSTSEFGTINKVMKNSESF